MNIEEFIETIRDAIDLIEQLDEPQPLKLKDITSRMKELDSHARSEWIDVILHEFGEEFGSKKYRDGYEQGKLEGTIEHVKPVVPQSVADWIEKNKGRRSLRSALQTDYASGEIDKWLGVNECGYFENQELFALAWILGYEVEKEKRYRVSMPKTGNYKDHAQLLCEADGKVFWCGEWYKLRTKFTRKELEDAGFSWVFDCEGIEIEEVK